MNQSPPMEGEDNPPMPSSSAPLLADLSKQKIRNLAMDIVENKVFGSWMIREYDMRNVTMVFMPMMFMTPSQVPSNAGAIYEYYDKAMPRSVNGMPIFGSMHILTKDDSVRVLKLAHKLYKKREWTRNGGIIGWLQSKFARKPQHQQS